MLAVNMFRSSASLIKARPYRSAALALAAAGLVGSIVCVWTEFVQSPNRFIFFHLTRADKPVIFGIERDELLKFKGKGSGRIRSALAERSRLKVQQFGMSKQSDGQIRVAPGQQIELTPADASTVRYGATFIVP